MQSEINFAETRLSRDLRRDFGPFLASDVSEPKPAFGLGGPTAPSPVPPRLPFPFGGFALIDIFNDAHLLATKPTAPEGQSSSTTTTRHVNQTPL